MVMKTIVLYTELEFVQLLDDPRRLWDWLHRQVWALESHLAKSYDPGSVRANPLADVGLTSGVAQVF